MADLTAEAVSATLSAIRTAANQISQKEVGFGFPSNSSLRSILHYFL